MRPLDPEFIDEIRAREAEEGDPRKGKEKMEEEMDSGSQNRPGGGGGT